MWCGSAGKKIGGGPEYERDGVDQQHRLPDIETELENQQVMEVLAIAFGDGASRSHPSPNGEPRVDDR